MDQDPKTNKIYTNVINFTERKNLEVEPVITKFT